MGFAAQIFFNRIECPKQSSHREAGTGKTQHNCFLSKVDNLCLAAHESF